MIKDYLIQPSESHKSIEKTSKTANTCKKKYKKTKYFIKGPIDWDWICATAKCNGRALEVAIVLHFLSGLKKSKTIKLPNKIMSQMGVDRHAKSRALKKLENEGLIKVNRQQGQAPIITIL